MIPLSNNEKEGDKMSDFGYNLNVALVVKDDGKYHVGLNYDGSDGTKFDTEIEADSETELYRKMTEQIHEGILKAMLGEEEEEKPEETEEELTQDEYNESLLKVVQKLDETVDRMEQRLDKLERGRGYYHRRSPIVW